MKFTYINITVPAFLFLLIGCYTSTKQVEQDAIKYLHKKYQQDFVIIDVKKKEWNEGDGFIDKHTIRFNLPKESDSVYHISIIYDDGTLGFYNDNYFPYQLRNQEVEAKFNKLIKKYKKRYLEHASIYRYSLYQSRKEFEKAIAVDDNHNIEVSTKLLFFDEPDSLREETILLLDGIIDHFASKATYLNVWIVYPNLEYIEPKKFNDIFGLDFDDKVNTKWEITLKGQKLKIWDVNKNNIKFIESIVELRDVKKKREEKSVD